MFLSISISVSNLLHNKHLLEYIFKKRNTFDFYFFADNVSIVTSLQCDLIVE